MGPRDARQTVCCPPEPYPAKTVTTNSNVLVDSRLPDQVMYMHAHGSIASWARSLHHDSLRRVLAIYYARPCLPPVLGSRSGQRATGVVKGTTVQ